MVPPYAGAPEDGDRAPAFSVARAAALARRRRCLLGFFLRQAANGASCWRRGATGSPDVAQAGRIAALLAGVHPARRSSTDDDGRPNPERHPAVLRFLRRARTRSSRSQSDRFAFFSRWRPHAGESTAAEGTRDTIIQVKDTTSADNAKSSGMSYCLEALIQHFREVFVRWDVSFSSCCAPVAPTVLPLEPFSMAA